MSGPVQGGIAVELSPAEVELIVAALRQYEPFWPAATDDPSRAALLDGLRRRIEGVHARLEPQGAATR